MSLLRAGRGTVAWGFLLALAALQPSLAISAGITLPESIPPSVDEIELTYTGENELPSISLKGLANTDPSPSSYRPSRKVLELLPNSTQEQRFGACDTQTEWIGHTLVISIGINKFPRCGLRFPLVREDNLLDALSFATLHLRGTSTGRASLHSRMMKWNHMRITVPLPQAPESSISMCPFEW